MPTVRLPAPLRPLADGAIQVRVDGQTVGAAIDDLVRRHPPIGDRILLDGRIAPWLNVFVGTRDVRSVGGMTMSLHPGDIVTLVPAVAGG